MIAFKLFFEFFKVGLFSVGGGMATIPFLTALSEKTGWFTLAELGNMIAVSESTPGPIGVNMSTYVGYKLLGIPGGIIASLGLVFPSFLVIIIISGFLEKFRSNKHVDAAFHTIRPASTALITSGLYSLVSMTFVAAGTLNIKALCLAAAVFVLTNYVPKVKKLHPIVFILLAAIVGIILEL